MDEGSGDKIRRNLVVFCGGVLAITLLEVPTAAVTKRLLADVVIEPWRLWTLALILVLYLGYRYTYCGERQKAKTHTREQLVFTRDAAAKVCIAADIGRFLAGRPTRVVPATEFKAQVSGAIAWHRGKQPEIALAASAWLLLNEWTEAPVFLELQEVTRNKDWEWTAKILCTFPEANSVGRVGGFHVAISSKWRKWRIDLAGYQVAGLLSRGLAEFVVPAVLALSAAAVSGWKLGSVAPTTAVYAWLTVLAVPFVSRWIVGSVRRGHS